MTQEDKNLLLQDLCGRLPYGVVVHFEGWNPEKLTQIDLRELVFNDMCGIPKPYLRPLSSMTEKENLSLAEFVGVRVSARHGEIYFPNLSDNTACNWHKAFDWLNKNMFDYRGLIPAGLANAALEGMYNS